MTPDLIAIDGGPTAPLWRRCRVCGRIGEWGPRWQWYGSYADLDNNRPIIVVCSDRCRYKLIDESGWKR